MYICANVNFNQMLLKAEQQKMNKGGNECRVLGSETTPYDLQVGTHSF